MSRKSQTTVTFKVKMVLPEGANMAIAQAFIKSAIVSAPGGLDPKDPMFDLDRESITVALQEKITKYSA